MYLYNIILFLIPFFILSCGKQEPLIIVQAISYIKINYATGVTRWSKASVSKEQKITIENAAVSTMELAPMPLPNPITPGPETDIVDIGEVKISQLFDNDLKHCPGSNLVNKCRTAGFRTYLLNAEGLVNQADPSDILPVWIHIEDSDVKLGVGTPGHVLQSITIPIWKNNIRLVDFSPDPAWKLSIDLINAGAGVFSGTLVIEYFIAP